MASGKRRKERREGGGEPAAEYYKLKTQAVEDLAGANEANSPPVSEEELRRYGAHTRARFPNWLKVGFVKAWFAGAVCFFFLWGLGTSLQGLDLFVVTALALGVVTDLLTNNVLRFLEETPGGNDRWIMFPQKKFVTLFLNILYAGVIFTLVYLLYNVLNLALITLAGASGESVPLGVEPVLFGIFCMLFDVLLVKCKHLCIDIFQRASSRAKRA